MSSETVGERTPEQLSSVAKTSPETVGERTPEQPTPVAKISSENPLEEPAALAETSSEKVVSDFPSPEKLFSVTKMSPETVGENYFPLEEPSSVAKTYSEAVDSDFSSLEKPGVPVNLIIRKQ